jgi:hypothetical protein
MNGVGLVVGALRKEDPGYAAGADRQPTLTAAAPVLDLLPAKRELALPAVGTCHRRTNLLVFCGSHFVVKLVNEWPEPSIPQPLESRGSKQPSGFRSMPSVSRSRARATAPWPYTTSPSTYCPDSPSASARANRAPVPGGFRRSPGASVRLRRREGRAEGVVETRWNHTDLALRSGAGVEPTERGAATPHRF